MTPTKQELVAAWLPRQPWYQGPGDGSAVTPVGGFRLDDPAGEVGMELMIVSVSGGDEAVVYHLPMTYRGAPLEGDAGLIGTSEHGVLGRRWITDAVHDPVFVGVLLAFLRGETWAQHRTESDTPDARYAPRLDLTGLVPAGGAADEADGTVVPVRDGAGTPYRLRIVRVLGTGDVGDDSAPGAVTGEWTDPDGAAARGPLVVVEA